MKKVKLCYDLETTDIINDEGVKIPLNEVEIVQFSALIINDNDEIIKEINFFNKDYEKPITYLADVVNKDIDYRSFLIENGLDKTTFYNNIKELFNKYNIESFITDNGRNFDNKILKARLKSPTLLYLKKQHDTLIYENLILGCNNYGKMPDGTKVKRTLEENCKRHDIHFDEKEAHDGLYDCQKTFELFLSQKQIFEKNLKEELKTNNIKEDTLDWSL